jgi:hypothetical protein
MCERILTHTIHVLHKRRRKVNWIGHILHKNCLLQYVIQGKIEGRIEVTGRQGRRRMQLMDNFKEKRGYFKLNEEALDGTLRRTRFKRSYGTVLTQTTELMNKKKSIN